MMKVKKITGWVLILAAGMFVVFFTSGCSIRSLGMANYTRDIQSPDPCIRMKAVIYAGNSKDKRAIPLLVDRLEDEDEAVRVAAIESLKQITGQDFGYRCFDPPYVRAKAVQQWRQWMKEQATRKK
ncbi:MAG: HEAT repeat domain-containing protein [Phycisphaerae bacterium]